MKPLVLLLVIICCQQGSTFDWKNIFKPKTISKIGNFLIKGVKHNIKSLIDGKKERADGKPWFCHNLDCPPFKIVHKTDTYEERCYADTHWVMTETKGPHKGRTKFTQMFKKLYNYIDGENDKKEKIPMTAPVLVSVELDKTLNDTLDIQMNFFVPENQVAGLPIPTRSDVKIVHMSEMCLFVHSFDGWMMAVGNLMRLRLLELENALKKEGRAFDRSTAFFAGYDPPYRILNRHNEVMLKVVKEETKDTPNVIENMA